MEGTLQTPVGARPTSGGSPIKLFRSISSSYDFLRRGGQRPCLEAPQGPIGKGAIGILSLRAVAQEAQTSSSSSSSQRKWRSAPTVDDFYPAQCSGIIYDSFALRVVHERHRTGFEECCPAGTEEATCPCPQGVLLKESLDLSAPSPDALRSCGWSLRFVYASRCGSSLRVCRSNRAATLRLRYRGTLGLDKDFLEVAGLVRILGVSASGAFLRSSRGTPPSQKDTPVDWDNVSVP